LRILRNFRDHASIIASVTDIPDWFSPRMPGYEPDTRLARDISHAVTDRERSLAGREGDAPLSPGPPGPPPGKAARYSRLTGAMRSGADGRATAGTPREQRIPTVFTEVRTMNISYLLYQAERTRSVAEQREVDAQAGQLAAAIAQLRHAGRRPATRHQGMGHKGTRRLGRRAAPAAVSCAIPPR
jgi:hypothetical protein